MSDYLVVVVLGLLAGGAVLFPVLVGWERYESEAELDADVERYRTALREGSLCARCSTANPAGSRFCGECGTQLV